MNIHVRGLPRSGTSLVNTLLTRNLPTDSFNVTAGNRHHFATETDPEGWLVHVIKHPLAWVNSIRAHATLPYTTPECSCSTVKTDETVDFLLAHQWLAHNQNLDQHANHTVRHEDILTQEQQAGWVNQVRGLLGLDTLENPLVPEGHVNDSRERWDSVDQMRAWYEKERYRDAVDEARITSCFTSQASAKLLRAWGWGDLA